MPLKRRTKYGKITISDDVFQDIIVDFCQREKFYDRIWLAQKPNIKSGYDKDGNMHIKFSVYVTFGESLKAISEEIARQLAETIYKRTEKYPKKIVVNIAGIKHNTLVKRNMDVSVKFDVDSGESHATII